MDTTGLKIVLDTNIFITIIGTKSANRWIFNRILSGEFILHITNDIQLEYEEILLRKTNEIIANNIVDFLNNYPLIQKTAIHYNWNLITEDPDDNKFIDCAVSANAHCIVSNDKHFKPFKNHDFPPLTILTLEEFTAQYYS